MLNNQKSDASAIQVFNSPQFGEIRTAGTSEEPLFCLSDVCSVLGLRQGDVKQRLDDGVVSTQPIIDALGREQQANFVNEDGLYDVILDSRKPQAKAFRKWVTSEVLPAIRKTGGYLATKQIGMDAEKLHKKLKEIGIIYRQSGQWILHAPYSTWGMHSTRTQTYTRSDGSTGTSVYTVWTTKGVRFIIALYENDWNVKKAIKQIKGELNPAA